MAAAHQGVRDFPRARADALPLPAGADVAEGAGADAIRARAQALGVDLIGLATHGRGGLERLGQGAWRIT